MITSENNQEGFNLWTSAFEAEYKEEMAELLALDLTEKKLSTDMLVLHVCYDKDNIDYDGELVKDKYGRLVPKPSHGTIRTKIYIQSSKIIREQFKKLYEKITDPSLMIRKVNLSACNLKPKEKSNVYEQVSLFDNNESIKKEAKEDEQGEFVFTDAKLSSNLNISEIKKISSNKEVCIRYEGVNKIVDVKNKFIEN